VLEADLWMKAISYKNNFPGRKPRIRTILKYKSLPDEKKLLSSWYRDLITKIRKFS
jgi:hypothetical protein